MTTGLVARGKQGIVSGVWVGLVFTDLEFGGPAGEAPYDGIAVEEDGLYAILVGYAWAFPSSGILAVRILLDGQPCVTYDVHTSILGGDGITGPAGVNAGCVPAVVGQKFSAEVYQSSGETLDIGSNTDRHSMCSLQAVKVG